MREFFITDQLGEWKKYTPEALWDDYEEMKSAVLAAKDNLFTASI